MLPILVSGGSYPDNWKSIQTAKQEDFIRFDKAQLLVLDWDSGEVIREISYLSPPENINPSMMFKVCDVTADSIIPVTNSEIVEYDRDTFEIKNIISHHSFNDLHSVKKIDDLYYVVNTGLELLQVVNSNGDLLEEYNMAVSETWARFSRETDYRKIGSTKPHETHINHIFVVDEEIFVTRLLKRDAINIASPEEKYEIEVGLPHDGVVFENNVFFTTTNGHLVTFDKSSKKKLAIVDINKQLAQCGYKPGGWCRGVLPLSNARVLVGYTELRHTKFREFISWARNFGDTSAPSRIIEIDLNTLEVVKEYIYPGKSGAALFSIMNLQY